MSEMMFTERLAVATDSEATAQEANGSCGQGNLLRHLEKDPLARSELGKPRGYDHVHLSRYNETDIVQWWGRRANGYHYPIGRAMVILKPSRAALSKATAPKE